LVVRISIMGLVKRGRLVLRGMGLGALPLQWLR